MVAIAPPTQPVLTNRRRRVRHKIQTPAYATFTSEPKSGMLDLHEIVDISEDGVAIQCHSPLEVDKQLDMCLDLADCADQILTPARVIWVSDSGRAGLRFSELPITSLLRLREWLFVNVMAGVANSETEFPVRTHEAPRPGYTDMLAAASVVQRQVEALGSDFSGAVQLIAERAQTFLRASGVAIALSDAAPDYMVCRASSGSDAPPVGARLQVGSGFSGQCVKGGVPLRCDDAEFDVRVDRESCCALGIRSILAAPIRAGAKSIGLIEAFSASPNVFSGAHEKVLLKFAEVVRDAAVRAGQVENPADSEKDSFVTSPGSVLFAAVENDRKEEESAEQDHVASSIGLPRSYLWLLTMAAGAISLVLGLLSAAGIQASVVPWIIEKGRTPGPAPVKTVLASFKPPAPSPAVESASLEQLKELADAGDPQAENALGLRYATGDGIKLNEHEAVRWFIRAAEQGNVAAQSKLGSIYYSGRGVPQDPNRAYFWMVVARLNGDEASKTLSPFVQARLTRGQIASIEENASHWFQQHASAKSPSTEAKANL